MTIQAKITGRSKKIVREIVHETGESQIAIIERALTSYYREWRMQKVNVAYAKLRQDKKSWKEELSERSGGSGGDFSVWRH